MCPASALSSSHPWLCVPVEHLMGLVSEDWLFHLKSMGQRYTLGQQSSKGLISKLEMDTVLACDS